METPVGFIGVKSSPVYFFLQKAKARYSVYNVPMPFEVTNLNIGNAMNTTTATDIRGGLAMTLHSTLKLQADDKISLVLTEGIVHDFYESYSHFVGWLLEEHEFVV